MGDRDNVKRLVNEAKSELKRDIAKEHQDRLDAALEQRSEILEKVRGGSTRTRKNQPVTFGGPTIEGATEEGVVTLGQPQVEGSPVKISKTASRPTIQMISMDEPEERKAHSIGSLGQRLSMLRSATKNLEPAQDGRSPTAE